MSAPTNISAATATPINATDTITQRVDDSGTTYTVWYKFLATFSGVLSVWGFGDLTTYKPGYTVYYNNGTTQFMNYNALPNNDATFPNRPFLLPVINGITYYFEFSPNSGNPSPANLTVSTEQFFATVVQAGSFITNRETDDDYEHPMTIASPTSNTVSQFVQVAPPLPTAVTSTGLPHGHYGAILPSGLLIYSDDSFGTIKIFNSFYEVVATITRYEGFQFIALGSNHGSGTFYVAYIQTFPGTAHLDKVDGSGNVLQSWTLTGVTSLQSFNVNADASFCYFTQQASNSTFKKINLSSFAITTLDTVTSSDVEDCLYLEDDTILVVYFGNGSPPISVTAKHYSVTGSVLNTYTFGGALYRDDFNPPRIGFALDSPNSFWITLKPQADFGTSIYKNIKVSDGSVLATTNQANYLFGQYIGAATATPPSRFGQEKSGSLLVAPVGAPVPPSFIGVRRTVPMKWVRRTSQVSDELLWQFVSEFQLMFQPGVGQANAPGNNPQIGLRWSQDGGNTWSNQRWVSAGLQGQYGTRAIWRMLGRGRNRVWELTSTDPVVWAIVDAFVQMEQQQ